MKDKYGYEIPDKGNVMPIKSGGRKNPDQEKIIETSHILIDKAIEAFPNQPPQCVNILITALEFYFIREFQRQIEKHEQGQIPMYQTVCASIMHAQKGLSDMIPLLTLQINEIFNYLKNKPNLTKDEMNIIMKEMIREDKE